MSTPILSASRTAPIGRVASVSVRPARSAAPERVDTARAVAGLGIDGDRHADRLSPRQLLIADDAAYRDLALPAHALGENLLVTFDTSRLRSGTLALVGSDALLWLTFHCEACGHLNKHGTRVSTAIGQRRGMLARVVRGGAIRSGDAVVDLGQPLPCWSDDWRARVRKVLDTMPHGLVLEYSQLARLAGVSSSYCRAFPRLIRSFGNEYAHKAVPRHALAGRARWDGVGLFEDR